MDLDADGDQDLVLGAMNFGDAVPAPLIEKWKKENAAILVLRNQLR